VATILVHLKVREGQEANFETIAKQLYDDTHRLEAGCRRYEYWRCAEERRYYALLSFDDFTAFIEHQASDHHEAPDYDAMIEDINLEWIDPIQGASDLAATATQEMPADASELMKSHAVTFAAQLQDWWSKFR
jgi:quinol monooxygenase YgiN